MGTKMGPSYACLFMGFLEDQILRAYTGPTPELYKRYIDDGLGATSLPESDLLNFIHYMQSFHPSIKFTFDISPTSVTFLDISVSIEDGSFATSIHYKPTDSHSYLHYTSSHTPSTRNSIVFSQLLRLRRLCSDDEQFNRECLRMASFFFERAYPQDVVDTAVTKVRHVSRADALIKRDRVDPDRPTVCITFHPHTVPIPRILRSNWHILSQSRQVGQIFDVKPLVAYRRDRNLRDILVRAALPSRPPRRNPGTFPCLKADCITCPFLSPDTVIKGPRASFTVRRSFNCQSHNVVYAVLCTHCDKIYVGETFRSFRVRTTEHLADVRHRRNTPVAKHFRSPGHSIHMLKALCLWQVAGDDLERKRRESRIISQLGSLDPGGMNIRQ